MLTTPDKQVQEEKVNDDIQNELLHHLSQDGGEADQPVVPWILSEDRSDTGFPPVLGHFSCPWAPLLSSRTFLRWCGGLSNDICQLPQHSWVHSIMAHGFVGVQFA